MGQLVSYNLDIFQSSIFILCVIVAIGLMVGKVKVGFFSLGSSATLFTGLLASFIWSQLGPKSLQIPDLLFEAALIGFVLSVGLQASTDLKGILKKYGLKFFLLAATITATGAGTCMVLMALFPEVKHQIVGLYVGALTSSPGLATALEMSQGLGDPIKAAIGLGYAVSYLPGVLIVIMFAQYRGYKKKPQQQKAEAIQVCMDSTIEDMNRGSSTGVKSSTSIGFDLSYLAIVVLVGMVLGAAEIHLGPKMQLTLGNTGGILIAALTLGGLLPQFRFCAVKLSVVQDISLNVFLAIVGLRYGGTAVVAVLESGPVLLAFGALVATASLLMGYLVGRYMLKMDDDILVGAVCGGMTSTPGLAAAVDALKSDQVAAGYGATYPFALLGMIVFTALML